MAKNLITHLPVGISLGGESDIGKEWDQSIREQLIEKIELSQIPFIREENLTQNVHQRLKLLGFGENSVPKVFVNIGGATANIGTSPSILHIKPGVVKRTKMPSPEQQGVLHHVLSRNIPVIHLLFIKGLILEDGLPWDPVLVQHAK